MVQTDSSVRLQGFASGENLRSQQADELVGLVEREAGWLSGQFPDLAHRYSDRRTAMRSIGRVASHRGIEAYVVRHTSEDTALGISTIIRNQWVIHPVSGNLNGDDMDYWLAAESDEQLHQDTVRELMKETVRLHSPSLDVIASARPDQPQAQAFDSLMHRFGIPSTIEAAQPHDPWGLAKGGAKLQLYRLGKHKI